MTEPRIADQLLSDSAINAETTRRKSPFEFKTISPKLQGDYEAVSWEVERVNQKSVRMRRAKAHDIAFEDRVWAVMAGLGFRQLNSDRSFKLKYGDSDGESKQIDVFAADDETILIVECKSTETPQANGFKGEVEAIKGYEAGVRRTIKKEYPDHKVKFILATNGYKLTKPGLDRVEAARFVHLDDDAIDYYGDLLAHLGGAARYQFLGTLFAGQKIPSMDSSVTAIRSKMGPHTYYSFSIEPARLLKLAYVLHRNKANSKLMPTYQRLIKRNRLKKVREFIDEGGFFPNSLILNVDSPRRGLKFERFAGQDNRASVAGLLNLPQVYRAAYVIDGQHRLYGYVDSERAADDLIPVVAFVNLPRSEQVRIFMQINENQAAVPKNLRNTLNADLLWDSEDLREQSRALKLRIAQHLGEDRGSPLFGRVIMGENKRSAHCCIAIETISTGLDRGNFLGSFTKDELRSAGTFYRGSNDKTLDAVTPFLEHCFDYLRTLLPEQWDLGNADGGFVFINNGVESLLRVLNDIVDHLQRIGEYVPGTTSTDEICAAAECYLDPLIEFLLGLDPEDAAEFRRLYGVAGRTRYWRQLQIAIRDERPEFAPVGLTEYLRDEEKAFNTESFEIVRDLEQFFKKDISARLEKEFGEEWLKKGVPKTVVLAASGLAAEKNLELSKAEEVEPWDCLHLIDYKTILLQSHGRWQKLFEKRYTIPGDEGGGSWKNRVSWMTELNRIRNSTDHDYSVKEEDYEFLVELRRWLIDGEIDNDLLSPG